MNAWLPAIPPERRRRWLAIAVAVVLVTSIASIGQVKHSRDEQRANHAARVVAGRTGARDRSGSGSDAGGSSATVAGQPGAGVSGTGAAGAAVGGAQASATGSGTPGGARAQAAAVPDFGLRTQGVTDKSVRIGA